MLRAPSKVGIWLLAASLVVLGATADLHAHRPYHEGTCLDSPSGEHSRTHAHGPCMACQAGSRQLHASVGAPIVLGAATPATELCPTFVCPPVRTAAARTSEPRAPPCL